MSSKRRKLDSTTNPPPSAFAARIQRGNGTKAKSANADADIDISGTEPATDLSETSLTAHHLDHITSRKEPQPEDGRTEKKWQYIVSDETTVEDRAEYTETDSSVSSRDSSPPKAALIGDPFALSTVKPCDISIRDHGRRYLRVKIAHKERLIALGQFGLQVEAGQISILGSTLSPNKTTFDVLAPASHALPVIRCLATETEGAVVHLQPLGTGLELLKPLSPLFGSLWGACQPPMTVSDVSNHPNHHEPTYRILHTSNDVPSKMSVTPLLCPPEWNETLAKFSPTKVTRTPIVFICGPKNAGKSTFAKLLGNRLLSFKKAIQDHGGSPQETDGIALLDLDPGQPEFSTPGQLSLIYSKIPNFGPPFAHPLTTGDVKTLRAHTIGALTPAADPSHFLACSLDLCEYYRYFHSLVPKCPLIINTPGWILGTGLQLLCDLISKISPTDVIYMSKEGPSNVVQTLQEASTSAPLTLLPSQASESTTRTSAQLRTMQFMSYFHLYESSGDLAWNEQQLSSIPPLVIRYSGDRPGILGIICYGEQLSPDLLAEAINGSILAVVVNDDSIVAQESGSKTNLEGTVGPSKTSRLTQDQDIVYTPEALPYLYPTAGPLDPTQSHTLGLLLVRGIDVHRRCLQVLTPIPINLMEEALEANKSIVLVSGKFGTPGWAYLEGLHTTVDRKGKGHMSKMTHLPSDVNSDVEHWGSEIRAEETEPQVVGPSQILTHEETPWVENLEGSQGKGSNAKVWRVRRDLGKSRNAG